MLRIYLDWNCITHLKELRNKQLFDFILSSKEYFIFPFSPAHFENLQRSRPSEDKRNEEYYKDLDNLHNIFENHLIMFDNEKKRVLPFAATPYGYVEKSENSDTLDDIFKYDSFFENLTENIGEPYCSTFDKLMKRTPIGINIPIFSNEEIKNGTDLLNLGFSYMKKLQTSVNYNKELSAGINDFDKLSYKCIAGATSDCIHEEIDRIISKSVQQLNMDKLIDLTLQNNA